jgi:hypothetical protein
MITSSVMEGTPAGLQFPAVAQEPELTLKVFWAKMNWVAERERSVNNINFFMSVGLNKIPYLQATVCGSYTAIYRPDVLFSKLANYLSQKMMNKGP